MIQKAIFNANEEKFGEKQFYYESQNAHSSQRFSHTINLAGMVKTNPIPSGETASGKVKIFLEQREVALLSPSNICENLNFSTVHL